LFIFSFQPINYIIFETNITQTINNMKKKVLDITGFDCPMTFIKAKEFIKSNANHKKIILIKGRDNLQKLENSLKKNFRTSSKKIEKDIFALKLTQ
jgi:TusA-related sulfurtransferase